MWWICHYTILRIYQKMPQFYNIVILHSIWWSEAQALIFDNNNWALSRLVWLAILIKLILQIYKTKFQCVYWIIKLTSPRSALIMSNSLSIWKVTPTFLYYVKLHVKHLFTSSSYRLSLKSYVWHPCDVVI